MKAIIVEDSRLARVELLTLLQAHPEVEVVGEAANAEEAKTLRDAFPEHLREIEKFVLRHGKRGKPVGARASDLLSLWDSMALHDALALVAPGQGDKRDAIAEKVSTVVRTYIKFGHLPWRGETHQQCVDIHTRRIVRLLDSLPMTSRSYRGFSIIRRE